MGRVVFSPGPCIKKGVTAQFTLSVIVSSFQKVVFCERYAAAAQVQVQFVLGCDRRAAAERSGWECRNSSHQSLSAPRR